MFLMKNHSSANHLLRDKTWFISIGYLNTFCCVGVARSALVAAAYVMMLDVRTEQANLALLLENMSLMMPTSFIVKESIKSNECVFNHSWSRKGGNSEN
jgi:hypothetical protein